MTTTLTLTASDGHVFSAYVARPAEPPRGHIVLIQEIFGVTAHIRRVADRFAQHGYVVAAPALFDRVERGVELPYGEVAHGKELQARVSFDAALLDIEATRQALGAARTAVVGYCWGGTLAYLAACSLPFGCAVAYYGGFIAKVGKAAPKAPTLYHVGADDPFIPPADVERIRSLDPAGTIHVYPGAGHGFNCDERADYRADSAALALERTLDHLSRHLGGPRP